MTNPEPQALSPTLREVDLRRHNRFLFLDGGVLRLAIRPEFKGRRGLLVDVSAGGIGFLLQEALEAGTALAFELKDANGADTIGRVARVRHSRPHPVPAGAPWLPRATGFSKFFRRLFGTPEANPNDKAWLVGCEFDRALSEIELKQLVAQLESLSRS